MAVPAGYACGAAGQCVMIGKTAKKSVISALIKARQALSCRPCLAMPAQSRIAAKFAELKKQNRKALVTFITAGDPDHATSQAILNDLPHWGADIIELGMPFSDPMADGPAIQEAGVRALKAGAGMKRTLDMAQEFPQQGR